MTRRCRRQDARKRQRPDAASLAESPMRSGLEGECLEILAHHANTVLEKSLREFDGDLVMAGDCHAPRTAEEAVYEGLLAGLRV